MSDSDGFAPLMVSFDASAAADPDGTITAYDWEFGDDATATGATVSHTFQDTGTFTVTLTVTDDDGATAATSRNIRARGAAVSGTIRIGAGSAVDSDVNDSFTTPVSNDDFGTAQAIDNPVRLGGFVNLPGTGDDDGNFRTLGDPNDYFFVELEGDERIVLSIAEPGADLDLELWSNEAEPRRLDVSMSPEPASDFTEDIPAPGAGAFFVRVLAVDGPTNEAGASNYVLSIEDDAAVPASPRFAKRLSDPFVPGELLISQRTRSEVERYRVDTTSEDQSLQLAPVRSRAVLDESGNGRLRISRIPHSSGAGMSPTARKKYLTLIAARAAHHELDAEVAEVNVLRHPMLEPNDPLYAQQWHYPSIGLEDAWEITTGQVPDNQVVVAVVDTGVALAHPDLDEQLLRDNNGQVVGFDFIEDPARANDGDGIDSNPDDPGDHARGPGTGSYHGTHVAGTVAAESNNDSGVAGVSWGARLMPLRALGIDGGTTFDVMQAVRYAAGLSNVSGATPPVRADIINLSLGSDFFSEAEQATIEAVRAEGVIVVASAGNDASNVPSYPASYDGVVSVSATTISGTHASYSNFGPAVDVAAPGGGGGDGVLSTLAQGTGNDLEFGAGFLVGTSMAAPHVSGVIALMKAIYPALTPAELDALLQDGQLTDDAGPAGRDDEYGWGIINAANAVQAALAGASGTQATFISVSDGQLNFQAFNQQRSFEITKIGTDPVAITVTENVSWLDFVADGPTENGFGSYTATVNRSNLPDDTYRATISIDADNPNVSDRSIQVVMQVTSPDMDADAGQHYVILVPPDAEESEVVQIVRAANGEYTFRLTDVAPGQYRLFAGTDHDNDAFICDGGEACGAYPTLSSPAIVSVDARQEPELTGQSFNSEYRTTVTTTRTDAEGGAGAAADGIAVPDKP
ncbi:MAG: S8 family serine peptidase [Gammaproteobacteria bacterium]|nr:S8 family serine peptidase [Gammaproteobacteria bacterium]